MFRIRQRATNEEEVHQETFLPGMDGARSVHPNESDPDDVR
jgi:hypothetical protein